MSGLPAPLLRSIVYGAAVDAVVDPAEEFHEASRLYPSLSERQSEGIRRLVADDRLQESTTRAGRKNRQLPRVALGEAPVPRVSLWDALARRRSRPPDAPMRLGADVLGRLLRAAYGVTAAGRRTVPSGGALYPLELYVVAQRVAGLDVGVHRFVPDEETLEEVALGPVASALAEATPLPELVTGAAAAVFLTGVFWRSRFKYGLRGYRFALLEAGHVAQNLLLAATAFDLAALPLGGFYDARVDALLGTDGVDESVLYGIVLGGHA